MLQSKPSELTAGKLSFVSGSGRASIKERNLLINLSSKCVHCASDYRDCSALKAGSSLSSPYSFLYCHPLWEKERETKVLYDSQSPHTLSPSILCSVSPSSLFINAPLQCGTLHCNYSNLLAGCRSDKVYPWAGKEMSPPAPLLFYSVILGEHIGRRESQPSRMSWSCKNVPSLILASSLHFCDVPGKLELWKCTLINEL